MFPKDYKWHYDYVRMAKDSGFFFENHKSHGFDKGKICLVDVDRVVSERDFDTIESFIPNIMEFFLDTDQVKVLDESFVKTFRMSQLAVEYLLFCKKYLDNSIVMLKKEVSKSHDENKELQQCVDELKDHVSSLVSELKEKTPIIGFKCEECSKVFSTEEYLLAHKNRRHTPNPESDRLQHEIKELKGRLNTAEQILHHKETPAPANLSELHKKIDDLRFQLHSELKVIESKHDIEEKYSLLLEKLSTYKGHHDKHEITTQTSDTDVQKENENQVIVEALERKVTSGLEKIEMQMQSVLLKVQEIERHKVPPQIKPRTKFTMTSPKIIQEPPKSIQEQPNIEVQEEIDEEESQQMSDASKQSSSSLSKSESTKSSLKNKIQEYPEEGSVKDSVKTSTESSISEKKKPEIPPLPLKQSKVELKQPVEKPKIPNLPSVKMQQLSKPKLDAKLLAEFKKEIEKLIRKRLEELGVSPDWTGLPKQSFEKALSMTEHHANLTKKTFPEFDRIAAQLERKVSKIASMKKPATHKTILTDSESEVSYPKEVKPLEKGKGVLKPYPSNSSLAKKRVLFNLQPKYGSAGSTTSIDSSVLDAPVPSLKLVKTKIHAVLSDSD